MPSRNDSPDDAVPLERFAPLHLISDTPKGRGVFASRDIPAGTIIDICAALVIPIDEVATHVSKTSLNNYTYNWPYQTPEGKSGTTQAVIFGLGSLFNHSAQRQNVGWKRDLEKELMTYRALRDVRQGEELCISYGDHLTFEDADEDAIRAKEDAEAEARNGGVDLLAKIDLV